jgi:hypothetical protein
MSAASALGTPKCQTMLNGSQSCTIILLLALDLLAVC